MRSITQKQLRDLRSAAIDDEDLLADGLLAIGINVRMYRDPAKLVAVPCVVKGCNGKRLVWPGNVHSTSRCLKCATEHKRQLRNARARRFRAKHKGKVK